MKKNILVKKEKINEKIYIIILNWNGYSDTIRCVASLLQQSYKNFEILIVDNGSTDGSEAMLKKSFPNITLLQTGKNLGFAGGNNVGIGYALKEKARYVLILNNDTLCDKNLLQTLLEAAQSSSKVGIVGSLIYYFDNPRRFWNSSGGYFRPTRKNFHSNVSIREESEDNKYIKVDYVSGTCMLINTSLLKRVGLIPEEYFLYYEDLDFSLAAKRAGYDIFLAKKSRILHKISASMNNQDMKLYYLTRNGFLFAKKYSPLYFLPGLYLFSIGKFVRNYITYQVTKDTMRRSVYLGIFDFWKKVQGERKL